MSLRRGLGTLGAKLLGYGVAAAVSVWVARALGTQERGIWSMALLIAMILGLLADGGVAMSSLFVLRTRRERARATVYAGLGLVALGGSLWSLLAVALALRGRLPIAGVPIPALVLGTMVALASALTAVVRQLLNAVGDLEGVSKSLLLQTLALPPLLFLLLRLAGPTATAALLAYVLALVLTLLASLWRLAPWSLPGPPTSPGLLKPLVTYGLKSQVPTLAMVLAFRSDLFLVSHYLGLAAAGVYSVALTLSEILRGVAETAQMLVVTRATEKDLGSYAQVIARQAVLASGVAGLALALASDVAVPLVFGEAYRGAASAFWYLVPGVVGLALSYSLSPLLFLEGRVFVNGVGAVCALAALWAVGTSAPGEPSLAKFAVASTLAYWVLAAIQVGYLRGTGRVAFRNLVPTWGDAVAIAGELGSIWRQGMTRVRSLRRT